MKFLKSIFAVAIAAMAFSACTNELDSEYKRNEVKLRTENEAISIAIDAHKAFFGHDSRATKGVAVAENGIHVVKRRSSRGVSNDTLLYIVNYEDNGGFAVVSASPSTTPLIGIAEEGNYQPEEGQENPNFQFYLDQVCEHLENNMEQSTLIPIGPNLPPRDSIPFGNIYTVLASKGPYVDLKWGQGYPYGSRFDNGNCGIVPPVVGMIAATLWNPQDFYLAGIHDNIDWEEICKHKGNGADCTESNPTATHNKIAELMKFIEQESLHWYANDSIQYSKYLESAFTYIGYNHYAITTDGLHDMNAIKAQIDTFETAGLRKALVYAMEYTPTGLPFSDYLQHCWIIDGYKVVKYNLLNNQVATYLHCNWACDGNSNGYFLPDSYLSVLSYDNANHSYTAQLNGAIEYYAAHIDVIVGSNKRQ